MLTSWVGRCPLLQEFTKLLNGESGVTHDPTEREGDGGVVPRNRQDARAVRHDDVLALAGDRKSGLLQRTRRVKVVDAGNRCED